MPVADCNQNFWPLGKSGRKSLVGLGMRGRDFFLIDWPYRGRQWNEQEDTEITEKNAALEAAGLPLCFFCCLLMNAGRWLRILPQQVRILQRQLRRPFCVAGYGVEIAKVDEGFGQGMGSGVGTASMRQHALKYSVDAST
jgi:hypothetical protein